MNVGSKMHCSTPKRDASEKQEIVYLRRAKSHFFSKVGIKWHSSILQSTRQPLKSPQTLKFQLKGIQVSRYSPKQSLQYNR